MCTTEAFLRASHKIDCLNFVGKATEQQQSDETKVNIYVHANQKHFDDPFYFKGRGQGALEKINDIITSIKYHNVLAQNLFPPLPNTCLYILSLKMRTPKIHQKSTEQWVLSQIHSFCSQKCFLDYQVSPELMIQPELTDMGDLTKGAKSHCPLGTAQEEATGVF